MPWACVVKKAKKGRLDSLERLECLAYLASRGLEVLMDQKGSLDLMA